ncbi:LysR family transcriptional regulator [Ktedonosporobacter rubrisoli]|uniref:LysR family transcriptional regulator n=1 Tax=Ktedonosporobacter rubrisoli TaxID=2509675 RepID=A0A4P6JLL5_KTERU|nr:LysR family transcriptional regulator [Ktedonosporobacter rubrisoli]QBD76147.1 LysR family transcriptional regulator [Ktedonosporobacter rubrisoli]
MEFRQLSYFLAAAQTQNFRKAAELCLVAQPALSRQIAALEAELGVTLFKRVKQRVMLTSAGLEFARYARSALDQLQQGQLAMVHIQEGQEGIVTLGCVEPLATAFLPALFRTFHQHYPRVRLNVHVCRTDEVLNLVEQGDVDLGLIFQPTLRPDVLVMNELFRQSLYLLVPAQHPFAQYTSPLALEQIVTEPLIFLRETSRLRRSIERILSQHGLSVEPVVEIDSLAGLKELVRQGCGVTIIPPALLESDLRERDMAIVPIADLTEQYIFALVYRRFGWVSGPARQFIKTVTETTTFKNKPDRAQES